jgi:GR25 family glycosyltransferase involved in LPS biosynthesis
VLTNKQKNNTIKIINLKRREDRKNQMLSKLNKENITIKDVEFIEAVDGKTFEPTLEIKNLFNAGFTHKRGVVGCALSHYNLWTQLINDIHNDYYIIMEDDIVLCNGFKQKIEQLTDDMKNKDLVFIGYHKYSTEEREIVINEHIKINETTSITISSLNKSRSGSGAFCYSINKNCAKKYIDYIKKHKIHRDIDWFMIDDDIGVECYELHPLLVISSHPFDWITMQAWDNITELEKAIPETFTGIANAVTLNPKEWQRWYLSVKPAPPESAQLPGEWETKCEDKLKKMIVLRCFRTDRVNFAIRNYVESVMKKDFVENRPTILKEVFDESKNSEPIIFVLSPGVDPTETLKKLAAEKTLLNLGLSIK